MGGPRFPGPSANHLQPDPNMGIMAMMATAMPAMPTPLATLPGMAEPTPTTTTETTIPLPAPGGPLAALLPNMAVPSLSAETNGRVELATSNGGSTSEASPAPLARSSSYSLRPAVSASNAVTRRKSDLVLTASMPAATGDSEPRNASSDNLLLPPPPPQRDRNCGFSTTAATVEATRQLMVPVNGDCEAGGGGGRGLSSIAGQRSPTSSRGGESPSPASSHTSLRRRQTRLTPPPTAFPEEEAGEEADEERDDPKFKL